VISVSGPAQSKQMKQLLTAAFFLLAFSAMGQIKVGIKAGAAIANYSSVDIAANMPENASHSAKTGMIAGIHLDIPLKNYLFFRIGYDYVTKGAIDKQQYAGFTSAFERQIRVFDFPLNILYKTGQPTGRRFVVGGGVVPGVIISRGAFGVGTLERTDFGANILAGYELPIGAYINLNFTKGLKNVAGDVIYFESLKNNYFGITLGFLF
jgi:hypothetical protein